MEQSRSLGADHVIDYTKENFTENDKKYDIILAVNGNYPFIAYKKALTPNGIYVMVGGSLSQIFKSLAFGWLMSMGSKKMRSLSAKANQADLEFLANLVKEGRIRPVIERHYPLEKTADAMSFLSKGHAKGKVVILVESK
jgi:NADPH:quinone reductase-like Zn-dependent oxidoreductase